MPPSFYNIVVKHGSYQEPATRLQYLFITKGPKSIYYILRINIYNRCVDLLKMGDVSNLIA